MCFTQPFSTQTRGQHCEVRRTFQEPLSATESRLCYSSSRPGRKENSQVPSGALWVLWLQLSISSLHKTRTLRMTQKRSQLIPNAEVLNSTLHFTSLHFWSHLNHSLAQRCNIFLKLFLTVIDTFRPAVMSKPQRQNTIKI